MKKISLLLTALFAIIGSGQATVVFHESFNKAAGVLNVGNTPAPNNTDWYSYSGTSNYISVAEGSLSYTGYVNTGIGNKAELLGNGADDLRTFGSISTGKVYLAAIINVDSLKKSLTGDYFLTLGDGGNSGMYARLYIRSVQTGDAYAGFNLGVTKCNENSLAYGWSNEVFEPKQNYLVVLEYEFVGGTKNDTARLYVNPTPNDSTHHTAECVQSYITGSGSEGGASGKDDAGKIASVNLRKGSNTPGRVYVDEIKVATSWNALFENSASSEPETTIRVEKQLNFNSGVVYTGESYTDTLFVSGSHLTGDITLSCNNGELSFSSTTITKAEAESENGAKIVVTLTPVAGESNSAIITLTSGESSTTSNVSWYSILTTPCATLSDVLSAIRGKEAYAINILYTGEAVITYIGTNNDGNTFYYVEDATAAIQVSEIEGYYMWEGVRIGDKITGFAASNLEAAWGILPIELIKSQVTILSSDNDPTPQIVTLAELQANASEYLLELVKVEDVILNTTNPTFIQGNTQITQNSTVANINIQAGNELIGTEKPAKADVTGVSSSSSGTVIRPRGKADIVDKYSGTAINKINMEETNSEIYTIFGFRTDRLQRGINIIRQGDKTYKVVR